KILARLHGARMVVGNRPKLDEPLHHNVLHCRDEVVTELRLKELGNVIVDNGIRINKKYFGLFGEDFRNEQPRVCGRAKMSPGMDVLDFIEGINVEETNIDVLVAFYQLQQPFLISKCYSI